MSDRATPTQSPGRMGDLPGALEVGEFRRFVALNASPAHLFQGEARRRAMLAILDGAAACLAGGASRFLAELPALIGSAMGPMGWLWNGFYAEREDGHLHLASAYGPPVCTPLERLGSTLTSGMCHDAMALNQTLAAYEVSAWPGYVSCDSQSGLGTVSSIVCPVRDRSGRPIAVWDLDATLTIELADVRFLDVLFATAARCVAFCPASFS